MPPRPIPYHLKTRVNNCIDTRIKEGVIEEHPPNVPAPWVSCAVIVPKPDNSLRITMDARNLNKSLISNNYPIPQQEDIRAQLSGANYFSKLDFKTAFWQLELDQESRALTVFHANDKLYRYTRLIMGIKPAQAELSAAFRPLFSHIPNVYLIHDDLIIATISFDEHLEALLEVMEIIKTKNLILNPKKCIFAAKERKFWGMIFSSEGVKPDPEKIKAITDLEPPKNKEELKSFICMIQSNSDFIPCFSKLVAPLRLLLNSKERFNWNSKHQKTFDKLLQEFRKETLLTYFDINKQTFIFTDVHKTGFSAILAQDDSVNSSKPVAIVSRSTSKAEQNYAQLDLEAMAVDYALRRFRTYLIGSPRENIIITDHLPLLSVFNGKKSGSIMTERIKLRHQDVRYVLEYKKGQENFADYLSRHAIKWKDMSKSEREEPKDLTKLLYTLHVTPVLDTLGIKEIAEHTQKDKILKRLKTFIQDGKTFIPKSEAVLQPFKNIFLQITVLNNGTLLKQDKIILPASLIDKALYLAHSGAHPGQNGLIRRLRAHFYIKGLDKIVKDFVQNCKYCQLFTQKTTKHPIEPNQVPEKCWDETSVDLFGPLPSKKPQ